MWHFGTESSSFQKRWEKLHMWRRIDLAICTLQVNYIKRSSFEFLNWLQFSSLPLQFKKLPSKSLEGICNVAKSRLNFPLFLLKVVNFLLQVPNFLLCSARCIG
jgi:hypothetical protein